jgi:hypothetical protein
MQIVGDYYGIFHEKRRHSIKHFGKDYKARWFQMWAFGYCLYLRLPKYRGG